MDYFSNSKYHSTTGSWLVKSSNIKELWIQRADYTLYSEFLLHRGSVPLILILCSRVNCLGLSLGLGLGLGIYIGLGLDKGIEIEISLQKLESLLNRITWCLNEKVRSKTRMITISTTIKHCAIGKSSAEQQKSIRHNP